MLRLLDEGADIDATDRANGQTALHIATIANHEAVVRALISRKANVAMHDAQGHSALHYAVYHDSDALVKLLATEASPRKMSFEA